MSALGHIVCLHNKHTHGENMVDPLTSNLWLVAPAIWACLIVYAIWYSTKAKHYAPITFTEAKQLWTIHRQKSSCDCKRWRQIRHQGQTVGFECGCGHKHVQQRPIVANAPSSVALQAAALKTTRSSSRS
jgi:hypothetical protein